jgi:hypothetical protein
VEFGLSSAPVTRTGDHPLCPDTLFLQHLFSMIHSIPSSINHSGFPSR